MSSGGTTSVVPRLAPQLPDGPRPQADGFPSNPSCPFATFVVTFPIRLIHHQGLEEREGKGVSVGGTEHRPAGLRFRDGGIVSLAFPVAPRPSPAEGRSPLTGASPRSQLACFCNRVAVIAPHAPLEMARAGCGLRFVPLRAFCGGAQTPGGGELAPVSMARGADRRRSGFGGVPVGRRRGSAFFPAAAAPGDVPFRSEGLVHRLDAV